MNIETSLTPEEVAMILNRRVGQIIEYLEAGTIRSWIVHHGAEREYFISPRVLERWISRRGLLIKMLERQMLTSKAVKEEERIAEEKESSERWVHQQMVSKIEQADLEFAEMGRQGQQQAPPVRKSA